MVRRELAYDIRSPNIWGAVSTKYGFLNTANGAFALESKVPTDVSASSTGGDKYEVMNLSAERLNSLYGASSTVQTSAIRSLSLIRAY